MPVLRLPLLPAAAGKQHWGNLPGAALSLAIAEAASAAKRFTLLLTADSQSAERLEQELSFFAPDLPVLHFPDWETLPYDLFSPHQDIISQRIASLYRLPELEHGVLVVPITTALHRLAPTKFLLGSSLVLDIGQKLDVDQMRTRLEASGYRCVDTVYEHGEFAVRGALIDLFPNPLIQSLLAVVAGVAFFATRSTRYTLATAAITLMVLFCFNQVGDGYGLLLPRLLDTLLGSLIAGLAVFLFLPDWQGRRLNKVLANTLTCNSIYLRQIMQQYAAGKRDDLAYRLARRNAHNADAALSTTLANMLMEPGHFRKEADVGFRFLVLSHTLLSYLSGLGAHRETQLPAEVREHLIDGAGHTLAMSIDEIASGLANKQPIAIQSDAEEALAAELEQMPDEIDEGQRLVQTQLALICRQLGPLRTLAAHLIKETSAA